MKVSFSQNIEQAIVVMRNAGEYLLQSGKNPSKWWQLENLNKKFLLQYAKPEEFYVGMVDDKPAVAAILQKNQNAQNWENIDGNKNQPALYIHWLCVTRQFAGKDLPQDMIDFAGILAKKNGIYLLRVDTNANENKLRNIYENLDFQLIAIKKEDYRQTALYEKNLKN